MLSSVAATYEGTREHPRIEVNIAAKLVAHATEHSATLANMARGGVFVATAAAAPVGAQVTLRFRLVSALHCEASGRVVWQRDSAGFGVVFEATNKHMESFTRGLAVVPEALRTFYLADVIDPRIEIA